MSRAYSCLSDPQQRAHYDRFGREDSQQRLRRSGAGGPAAEGFDPDELFNMFFGGGFPSGTRCAKGVVMKCMSNLRPGDGVQRQTVLG